MIKEFAVILKKEFLEIPNPSEKTFLEVITNLKFLQSDLLQSIFDNIFKKFNILKEINAVSIKNLLIRVIN